MATEQKKPKRAARRDRVLNETKQKVIPGFQERPVVDENGKIDKAALCDILTTLIGSVQRIEAFLAGKPNAPTGGKRTQGGLILPD